MIFQKLFILLFAVTAESSPCCPSPLKWVMAKRRLSRFQRAMKTKDQISWMSRYQSKRIWELALPASHNSGTFGDHGGPFKVFGNCQSLNITEQLNLGIRFFDLRAGTADSENEQVFIAHGDTLAGILYDSLASNLLEIQKFTIANPTEVIVISLKQEYGQENAGDLIQEVANRFSSYFAPIELETLPLSDYPRSQRIIILTDLVGIMNSWGASDLLTSIWTESEDVNELQIKLKPYFGMSKEPQSTKFRWVKGEITRNLGIVRLLADEANPVIFKFLSLNNTGRWFNVLSTDFVEERIINQIIKLND